MQILGQIFAVLAALSTFLSYQFKTQKQILILQTFSSLSICISYLLLGAYSGMILNVVCIFRNFVFYNKDTKFFSYPFWTYFFAVVMGVTGILSWQGPLSLLVIVALVINTLFLSYPNVQNIRKSILLTSTLTVIYNIYFQVWGGVANELIAITSAVIGLLRYKKQSLSEA